MGIPASELRGGVDYPRNRLEFDDFFPDEGSCLAYLEQLRWPEGFLCRRCEQGGVPWRSGRGLLVCPECGAHTSVLAGTVFHRTRTPLRTWFLAAWEITSQKYGANALGLQRVLGLKSYQTAWAWLHKFRRAMVRPNRERLGEIVEIDETYVGGVEEGVRGRYTEEKAIVLVAVEIVDERQLGRVRLRPVPDLSAAALEPVIGEFVEPGTSVLTDGWSAYSGLEAMGYDHIVINQSASPDPAHVLMPGVHRVASLVKRWLLGTYQGAVSREHLPYYLDEFTFRFNRRSSRARGLLFYRLIEQAAQADHTPTAALYQGTGRGPRRRRRSRTRSTTTSRRYLS
jgi:transposase-like protein